MNFSEKLKYLRKEQGMTQAQLAQKSGLSKGAIGNFESGKRTKISFESVCRLADALDVAPEELGLERRYDLEKKMQSTLPNNGFNNDTRLDEIMQAYYVLNDEGKTEALKRISELSELIRYRRR